MDKRLVGKWYKEEMGETLNIFDETPLRMKMSFSSSGFYNFKPNTVYEKDGLFCYEINDETYRMVYHVKFEDDCLVGFYTQFGKETPVRYTRVSCTPEDGEMRYVPTEIYVPQTEEPRIDVLRRYAHYGKTETDTPYTTAYRMGGEVPAVLERYGYADYLTDIPQNDDRVAFAMLAFVCDHFGHNGSGGTGGSSIEELIAFCETHQNKTNCRGLSILLASLLRLNGIKARHITCMPYEDPFDDCHVVVDCLLPSGQRIMLDPTERLYLRDKDGAYVSLPRLREMLIAGEEVFANEDASYNGGSFDLQDYRNYMTKNTFRFSRGTLCADGFDDNAERRVELLPAGYPTENFAEKAKKEFVYDPKMFWQM